MYTFAVWEFAFFIEKRAIGKNFAPDGRNIIDIIDTSYFIFPSIIIIGKFLSFVVVNHNSILTNEILTQLS